MVELKDYTDSFISKSFKETQAQELLKKAARQGLTRKRITDKTGKVTTVWVKTGEEVPKSDISSGAALAIEKHKKGGVELHKRREKWHVVGMESGFVFSVVSTEKEAKKEIERWTDLIEEKQELKLIGKYNQLISNFKKFTGKQVNVKEVRKLLDKIEGQVPMRTKWNLQSKRRTTTIDSPAND